MALLSSCATADRFESRPAQDALHLARVDPTLDFRDGGEPAALLDAVVLSRKALRNRATSERQSLEVLESILRSPSGSLESALAARFRTRSTSPVLLTGYYEPTLPARAAPDARFRYPLFSPPAARGRQPSRAEIDSGALAGRDLELFWLDDPVEAFFLHIQGSGRLELEDGSVVRVGYAGNNGRAYRSIGSELVARGVFTAEEATAPAIKRYLRAHPEQMRGLLHENPRYIFFRTLDVPIEHGPIGSLGAPLVPFRSVAADPKVTPPGSIGILSAPLPDGRSFSALVVAMDTGAAIQGAGRLDLFVGAGPGADLLAGELRSSGQVSWLELR